MWQQVRESCEGFPMGRGASESMIEAAVDDQVRFELVRCGPKIANCISFDQWLGKMPNLARDRRFFESVGNRDRLAELSTSYRFIDLL